MRPLLGLAAPALIALAAVTWFAPLARAGDPEGEGVQLDLDAPPPRMLSSYRLFRAPGSSQRPTAGVVPYDVNTPLFSDYAFKHRFVSVPSGDQAKYHAVEPFGFPVGTILVKTFAYPLDVRNPERGERLIETRLLIHKTDGWVGLPYVWNSEQTDARLRVAGAVTEVAWIDAKGEQRSLRYLVPNSNQCKSCHERGGVLGPIGPTARNLNRDLRYPGGHEANQLVRWRELGILPNTPDPATAPRLPVWDDPESGSLSARARAYLEVNCAHCHDPKGAGNTSGLDLRASQQTPVEFGVFRSPVAAGKGTGGRLFDIVPGDPDGSVLLHRMESTDPGVQMPELGRRLVHTEGVALVRDWIASLSRD